MKPYPVALASKIFLALTFLFATCLGMTSSEATSVNISSLATPSRGAASSDVTSPRTTATYQPGEVLLILAPDTELSLLVGSGVATSDPDLAAVLDWHGLEKHESIVKKQGPLSAHERRYVKLFSAQPGFDPVAAARDLVATDQFVAASPNYQFELFVMPNDPYLSSQWAVHSANDADIDMPEAWDIEQGDPAVVIAIVDTGLDWGHPDLAPNVWHNPGEIPGNGVDDDANGFIDDVYGWDCGDNDSDPRPEPYLEAGIDVGFHGTHCAGIAAARTNNALGIAGASWGCAVMGLKVTSASGSFTTQAVTNAFLYAIQAEVDVISMSFGGTFQDFGFMQSLVDDATQAGIVCVAAAGNDNSGVVFYPAGLDNVLAVGATNQLNQRAAFSSYGAWVDVAAPGEHIWSCVQTNYSWDLLTQLLFALLYEWDGVNPYMYSDGTSMACPLVAGVCALVRSAAPWLSAEEVAQQVIDTGDVVSFDQPLGVKVNAFAAVQGLVPAGVAGEVPDTPALLTAIPNPFNPQTTLHFNLPVASATQLDIFDVRGRLVHRLVDEIRPAGKQAVPWNGTDRWGRQVTSGLFIARLTVEGVTRTLKLTMMK
jgi:subtilisin family serine protease